MDDYVIRYVELPRSLPGVTVRSADGCCNIYINSCLSPDKQREALNHEMTHVLQDDFDSHKFLEEVEPYRAKDSGEHLSTVGDLLHTFVSMESARGGASCQSVSVDPPDIFRDKR